MIKNVMDNNRVYAAMKAAYVKGWEHHKTSTALWDEKLMAETLSLFWPKVTSMEFTYGVESQLAGGQTSRPVTQNAINVTLIVESYKAGVEGATAFDDCKEHGAQDMPFQTWIGIMENEQAYTEYVEQKAIEHANRKYVANALDYNHQGIVIKSGGRTIGTYYGSLGKGDIVRFWTNYVRVESIDGYEASGKVIGIAKSAKVSSRHFVSGAREEEIENCEKGFLVEGGNPNDVDILVKEGIVPSLSESLASTCAASHENLLKAKGNKVAKTKTSKKQKAKSGKLKLKNPIS